MPHCERVLLTEDAERGGPFRVFTAGEPSPLSRPVYVNAQESPGGIWHSQRCGDCGGRHHNAVTLSMRQVEVSRTPVFDAPRRGRAFFEALVADNLDVGRPDTVELIFGRQVRATTTGVFATKVVTRGVDVTVNAFYKQSRIKQYLKEGRAYFLDHPAARRHHLLKDGAKAVTAGARPSR
jgi:hypothetical protein